MRTTKKISSMLLAAVMVLGLLPAAVFAADATEDVVYLSISLGSGYIDDKNGDPIAYVPVPLDAVSAIDLAGISIGGMSVKLYSDSSDENAMVIVDPQTLFVKRTVREDLYEVFRGGKTPKEQ